MLSVIKAAISVFQFVRSYRQQIEKFLHFAEETLSGTPKGTKLAYVLGRVNDLIETEGKFEDAPFETVLPFLVGHIDSRVAALFPKTPDVPSPKAP